MCLNLKYINNNYDNNDNDNDNNNANQGNKDNNLSYEKDEIEHLGTEELVFSFKQDYEETKKILSEKLIEYKEKENNYDKAIEVFNSKLEELQSVIDNLKTIVIDKENKIIKLKEKINKRTNYFKEEIYIKDVNLDYN